MKTICLIAYLVKKPAFAAYFKELAETGLNSGYKLIGLNLGSIHKEDVGFPLEFLPFSANTTYASRWVGKHPEKPYPKYIHDAADFEPALIKQHGRTAVASALNTYAAFLKHYFEKYSPTCVILGHQFSANHQVALRVCEELEIPVLYNHPGVLNGTMCYEAHGQMAESELIARWDEWGHEQLTPEDIQLAKSYLDLLSTGKLQRPGKKGDSNLTEYNQVKILRNQHKRLLLYAGVADYRTGVQPRSYRRSATHSSWITSSLHGLEELQKNAEKYNFHLIYKPHPLQPETDADILKNENITCIKDVTISDILPLVDGFATICSSASYEALHAGKSVILLGNMQAELVPSTLLARSPEALEESLEKCFNKDEASSEKAEFLEHVARLLKFYYYRANPALDSLSMRDSTSLWEHFEDRVQSAKKFMDKAEPSDNPQERPSKIAHYKHVKKMFAQLKPYGFGFSLSTVIRDMRYSYFRK